MANAYPDGEDQFFDLAPNIHQLLTQQYKWIFVGGKGGVGKTTCSCALALLLAKSRENVLLISSDPAHNLSDAFNQKIGSEPTRVQGTPNLFAMEISTNFNYDEFEQEFSSPGGGVGSGQTGIFQAVKSMFKEMVGSLPGLDEAMAFAEIIKLVTNLNFSVVVFDTAPTGHTLRFLSIPQSIQNGFSKGGMGAIVQQVMPSLGFSEGDVQSKLNENMPLIEKINEEFQDKNKTTFVCVCIAEFLSVYETERLIQALTRNKMGVQHIIVNQLLVPLVDSAGEHTCSKCSARYKIQHKYLEQVHELYEDYNIIEVPLMDYEVRGMESIRAFSDLLMDGSKIFSPDAPSSS